MNKNFNVVLFSPQIPGNTGSIGRSVLALGGKLILIHPLGFSLDEKSVRRAGLDYWHHVPLIEYGSFDEFLKFEEPNESQLFFLSKFASQNFFQVNLNISKSQEQNYFIFGQETKGLPENIHQKFKHRLFSMPMYSDKVRSYNLSNIATAIMFEFIRQRDYNVI